MATSTLTAESVGDNILTFQRLLAELDRSKVEAFAEVSIALLDLIDGDPDLEANGDEQDGTFAEDEPAARFGRMKRGPGCIHTEPDKAVDDEGCDDINDDREHEEDLVPNYGIDQTKGALPHDPGAERSLTRQHLDRIRRTRCERIEHPRGWHRGTGDVEFRLRGG